MEDLNYWRERAERAERELAEALKANAELNASLMQGAALVDRLQDGAALTEELPIKEALEVVFSHMDENGDPVGAQPETSWEQGYCDGLRYAYRVLKQHGVPLPASHMNSDGPK